MKALPVLLALAASPALLVVPANAQPTAGKDAATEMARKRFEEGVRLFDQGEYQQAQAAFLQAWALKKHPAVLVNLAQCELRAGEHVSAARHFVKYLRNYPDTPPDQQELARKGLAEARQHTGQLEIEVGQEGAEVFVDGELIGRSPLPDLFDVAPGTHEVEIRFPGKPPSTQEVSVSAASSVPVSFESTPPPGSPKPPPSVQVESSGRQPFLPWATSDPVAWATLGATGLGLGLGVTFSFMASSAAEDADSATAQISAVASRDEGLANYQGQDRRANPCAGPVPITAETDYRPACSQLSDLLDTRDSRKSKMWLGFGLAAVGAAGTGVAYYLRSDRPHADVATVAPVWTPEFTGVGVAGSF